MTQRTTLRFVSGDSECHSWLYLPDNRQQPHPVVIMAHGLGGTKALRLDAFAEAFSAAGYACLVFDYRHLGESGGQPRQLLEISRQLDDWRAAIDTAKAQPVLDPSRIILWGTSLAGGHVLEVAAGRPDIHAVISQCPFTDGLSSTLAVSPKAAIKVTGRAVTDLVAGFLKREPVLIPLAGEPNTTALMTAPDAMEGYHRLVPKDGSFNDQVSARTALSILSYRPGRKTKDISCPILFCICENDSVAPARKSIEYARRAPRADIECFPCGHFDIYHGHWFEQVIKKQLQFLTTQVPIND